MSLRDTWDRSAQAWGEFAASPDHDFFYWAFNRPRFIAMLPTPGLLTVDIGIGEGRLTAELVQLGHTVVGVDSSPNMAAQAVARPELSGRVVIGDSALLPLRSGAADLVVGFMSFQDMDNLEGAVQGAAELLIAGGRLCLAVAHPIRSAGGFESKEPSSPFIIAGSYFERSPWPWSHSHSGMTVSIPSEHRPLQDYAAAIENSGLLIESIREPAPPDDVVAERTPLSRWQRLPCFLHLRAVKPPVGS
jgi:SAM-dependent methyltransferase